MFFPSWKTIFKQSQHLFDTWLFVELLSCFLSQSWQLSIARWIDRESSWPFDSFLTASRSIEILLHALFFTCFESFFYLVIHIILFHYIHAFLWILCALLIIFIFLGWSVLISCTLCQSWQKGGEIVEIRGFFLKILYVKGRNTCLCKGEMCFILLMYVSFTYPYMCCFFSLFMHMFLITCMQSIISVSYKDALMSFV